MISAAGDEQHAHRVPDWSEVRRILLVRLRSIGDTVLMTPCLAALKTLCPNLEITVLLEPLSAPVLEDHPLVDHLLVTKTSLRERANVVAQLRRQRFDVAINLHGGSTAMFFTRLSGARVTTGYADYRYSGLLTHPAPAPDVILQKPEIHSVEQQLALLYWLGVPPYTKMDTKTDAKPPLSLTVSEAAKQTVLDRLRSVRIEPAAEARFAVISPAAALESKRWSAAAFARVTDHLAARYQLPSVLIAGPGQESVARQVAERSTAKPRLVVGLSLKELLALISLSSLFVGNDSGPMHLAAASGRPVVAIFGSSNANVWRPWTETPARIVEADTGLDAETRIASVAVEDVCSAVDEVLCEHLKKV